VPHLRKNLGSPLGSEQDPYAGGRREPEGVGSGTVKTNQPTGWFTPAAPPGGGPAFGQGKSAKVPAGTGRGRRLKGLRAFKPWNLRASGMPLSRRAHPYSPRPPAGGFGVKEASRTPPPLKVQVPYFRESALLCGCGAPTAKGRVPAKSAGAPTPAGPRVRVPRPTGDGAG